MQPYFFPYLGYFDLINQTDSWVVFDTVKYSPRSWMNRNRILHPTEGWQYVSVPVHRHGGHGGHGSSDSVGNVPLADPAAALDRIRGQLDHYRQARAPGHAAVADLLVRSFRDLPRPTLGELNIRSLALTCDYLGIRFDCQRLSELALPLPPIDHAGQWALEIATALGAKEYVNPPGGRDLFDPAEFARRGIRLSFTELEDFRYPCRGHEFIEHLSIIDVLMWNAPVAINEYLDARPAPREVTS